jgi:hypothetical protein
MGVWGTDAFGNDSACDWAAEFAETGTLELLTEELEDAASTRGYYRAEALVACEVVARLQGRWGKRSAYSEKIDEWVVQHSMQPSDELIDAAIRAIDNILEQASGKEDNWTQRRYAEAWRASVMDLRRRVGGSSGDSSPP